MGAHLEDVVVQFLPVQGFSHKHFTNGVIAGDNLKSPSNVTRSQGEDHLWEEREGWLVRLKGLPGLCAHYSSALLGAGRKGECRGKESDPPRLDVPRR